MSESSGRLSLTEGVLSYSSPVHGTWSIELSDLAILGEFTNDNGPYLDDYFLVVITRDLTIHEASAYAQGFSETTEGLSAALSSELRTGLANVADYASRIMWPEHLRGRPLYDFREVYLPGRWRWLRRLLRLPEVERRFLGTLGGRAGVGASAYLEAPQEHSRSVVTEADDAKIVQLLVGRDGVPTTVHLSGGRYDRKLCTAVT